MWFAGPSIRPHCFRFEDGLRVDAAACVHKLIAAGHNVEVLSGDRTETVARIADQISLANWRAECRPADKVARLTILRKKHHRVAMIGDGLNDAPALAAADVSLSPSTASDISQTAADIVFQSDQLAPVYEVYAVANRSMTLIRQNLGLALGYNLIAIPVALSGALTPLIAAIMMSASSIVVTLNALRVRRG